MRNIWILLSTFLVFMANGEATARKQKTYDEFLALQSGKLSIEIKLTPIIVKFHTGQKYVGLLIGLEAEAIKIRIGKEEKAIQLGDLAAIEIAKERENFLNPIFSMFLGLYSGNIIFNRAEKQPVMFSTYRDVNFGFFLANAMYAGFGSGIYWLTGLITPRSSKIFDFSGNIQDIQKEWQKFHCYVIQKSLPKRFYFSVEASQVLTHVTNHYATQLEAAGFWVNNCILEHAPYGWDHCGSYKASSFNLVRKAQATYSFRSDTEVGVALMKLGEPALHGEKYDRIDIHFNQKLDTSGLYAIGVYRPFHRLMWEKISWNLGLGLGVAKIDFFTETIQDHGYPTYDLTINNHHISKFTFSYLLFSELRFYLDETYFVGLAADYAFVPKQKVPDFPEVEILSGEFSLGNGSLGLILGFRF